jgi:3-hydroxyisobutyrate dehydrogenase-like beta-hydroxyacid dehydrogenase
MAASLVRRGFAVVGYDALPEPRKALRRAGGTPVESSADVARAAAVIITSLPSPEALLAVAAELSGSKPKAQSPKPRAESQKPRAQSQKPKWIIETSTLPLAAKEQARAQLAKSGITLLDCPLSGTGAQARTGDLVVYASGERAACRRMAPIFDGFARAHHYVGAFGAGSKTKFVANLLVGIHNVASAEAMVLAMKAGLDPALVLKVVADGVGTSRVLQLRGPMMVAGDYTRATMKLAVWKKDMTIISAFAEAVGCPIPLFSATVPVYQAALANGHGAEDTASVCAVLERLARVRRQSRKLV